MTVKPHYGQYIFLKTLLGLGNAESAFQSVVDIILSTLKWLISLVYLDDVSKFSMSVYGHLESPQNLLKLLSTLIISVKLKKCFIFKNCIDYLGHAVQSVRLDISTKVTNAICMLAHPRKLRELKSFVVLCIVFRRFVLKFASIAALLSCKLGKISIFILED